MEESKDENLQVKKENSSDTISASTTTTPIANNNSALFSKLENSTHEELIAFIKKQFIYLSNARKQIEIHRTEIQERNKKIEDLSKKSDSVEISNYQSTDMISLELKECKSTLSNMRKQLKSSQYDVSLKEELIKELTFKLDRISEEKENALASVRNSSTELIELHKTLDEKLFTISENTKIINSMVVEISELKNNMETETKRLNDIISEKINQILEIKKNDASNVAELKQSKTDLELFQRRYDDLQKEYSQFKERAQYVLKQQKNGNNEDTVALEASSFKSYFVEFQELIETLRLKNNEISLITNKCSILNEELQLSRQHISSLESDLLSANEQISSIQLHEHNVRLKLQEEYTKRFEDNLKEIERLKSEKNELNKQFLNEKKTLEQTSEERYSILLSENLLLKNDIIKLKTEIKDTLYNKLTVNQTNSKLKEQHQSNKKSLISSKTNILNNQSSAININYNQTLSNLLSQQNNNENEQNSESDDKELSFSLRSVLEEDDTADVFCNLKINDSKTFVNENFKDKLDEVERQLNYTLELLAETEETNIKLNEQAVLLKEEIRRMERNNERSAHITHNAEYLKNIIMAFLTPHKINDTRQQMLPILRMMLKLSADECSEVEKSIASTQFINDTTNKDENNKRSISTSNDWTSYISSLAGMF